LVQVLRERRVSQRKLAKLTNLSPNRISRLCLNQFPVRPEERRVIAEALQVEESEVFPFAHLGHLDGEEQEIERVAAWLRSDEGRLVWRRIREVLA